MLVVGLQGDSDSVVIIYTQAPIGTLADWREDVEALVESVVID
jgi:hypothetical protein